MLGKQFILVLSVILSLNLQAQNQLSKDISPLQENSKYVLPSLDNKALKKQYKDNFKTKNRFAEPRDVNISIDKQGTWESTKSDILIWRQAIRSPNAHSINLGFTKFKLPTSAKLFIYNSDKTDVLGPLTSADNDDHLQFWTPIVKGDEVIIELQINAKDRDKVLLELTRINHDFRGFEKSLSQAGDEVPP